MLENINKGQNKDKKKNKIPGFEPAPILQTHINKYEKAWASACSTAAIAAMSVMAVLLVYDKICINICAF